MLEIDSLVTDLIFQKGAKLDPEALVAALGGEEVASALKIIDPDLQDPRFEMELSPTMPFRRRGERRLMIVDDSVAPMRKNPRTDSFVPLDLRPDKERLISLCEEFEVRVGRLNALGSWGDAVIITRSAVDLRGLALILWALDPTVDVDGKKRANRLSPAEFEAKLAAYDKRLEELPEHEILAELSGARLERRGELLIVDVLEEDGTWDLRRSLALERSLAAVERFSLIPGAPAGGRPQPASSATQATAPVEPVVAPPPAVPLSATKLDGEVILVFPAERFDLDVAAQLGRKDWDAVLHSSDPIPGQLRDRIHGDGAAFIAPLEFLSEVFVDGKPLTRQEFEKNATTHDGGIRTLDVHCPRFGPVLLLDVPGRGRFISSAKKPPGVIVGLLA